ncbi:MAG TPA: hypothetical protein PKO15_01710 [Fibrobacteria bacterium]|nr:hypothetical protein [Fibrobacteria bacterium]HOX49851.1 hypothetical protein [Fibrobacteria bacterium]
MISVRRLCVALVVLLGGARSWTATTPVEECVDVATASMDRLRQGDSSAPNLLRLSQALECMGRPEDALGATYFASRTDSTGWTDLLIYRAYLLRSMHLDDEAVKVEQELGGRLDSHGSSGWVFEPRPRLSFAVGWYRQVVTPKGAPLAALYAGWNDVDWIKESRPTRLGKLDSVVIEGVQVPVSASMDWGAFTDRSSFMAALTWSTGLSSSLDRWRSQGLFAILQFDRDLTDWLASSVNATGSRSWYPVDGAPMAVEDEVAAGLSLVGRTPPGNWTFSNTLHASCLSPRWVWSGTHTLGWSRTWLERITPSVQGSFAWADDPNPSEMESIPAKVLLAQGIREGLAVTKVVLLDTAGKPVGEWAQIKKNAHPDSSVSRFGDIDYPLSIRQDWVQAGVGASLGLRPWKTLQCRLAATWLRTFFLEPQSNTNLEYGDIYEDAGRAVLYQDPATRELYATRSNSLTGLVPYSWTRRRRDDTWTVSAGLTWKALKWLSFQGTWTTAHTTSNVEDWLDGATSDKETISLGSSVSW